MKTTTFLVLLIFSSIQSIGQWEVIHGPTQQGNDYGGMSFVNDSTGFVVQRFDDWPIVRSLILKTIDYGNTWDTVYAIVDTSNQWIPNFSDVFFINEDEGWVCGTSMPFILHTEDGGATWSEQSISSEEPLEVQDANFGIIKFYNTDYGVALNGFSGQHAIETFDGGEHWTINDSLTGNGVSFIDECNYHIVSPAFDKQMTSCELSINSFPEMESAGGISRDGRSVHLNNQDLWLFGAQGLIGFNSFGSIIMTSDGGNTFSILDLNFADNVYGFEFWDEDNGFVQLTPTVVGGEPCSIMKTSDGGLTWFCQETPIIESSENFYYTAFTDIECPSPEICYANSPSRIFRTFNGGGPLGAMWTSIRETTSEDMELVPAVYPNPATTSFRISNLKPHIKYHLSMVDASGRKVLDAVLDVDNDILVESLSPGYYMVELRCDDACYQLRFLRQ